MPRPTIRPSSCIASPRAASIAALVATSLLLVLVTMPSARAAALEARSPASAAPTDSGARHIALAYEPWSRRVGYSFNQPGPHEAAIAALNHCGQACVVLGTYSGGCALLAEGPAGAFALGGASRVDAMQRLRSACTGVGCRVLAWSCSDPAAR